MGEFAATSLPLASNEKATARLSLGLIFCEVFRDSLSSPPMAAIGEEPQSGERQHGH